MLLALLLLLLLLLLVLLLVLLLLADGSNHRRGKWSVDALLFFCFSRPEAAAIILFFSDRQRRP